MQFGKITRVPFMEYYPGDVREPSEDDKMIDSLCKLLAKEFLNSVKPEVLKVLTDNVGPIAAKFIHTEGGRITTMGLYSQVLNIEVSLHHVKELMEQFMESVSFEIKDLGEKKCYYEFGYTSGPDNYYGRYSPLCETSEQCIRNNTIENLKMFVCMSFETRTENDRNLSSKGRSELRKLMKKLVEQITED